MAITMTIDVDDAGGVNVQGFPANEMLAYGMLEIARNALQRWFAEQQAATIKPPTQADMLALRRARVE